MSVPDRIGIDIPHRTRAALDPLAPLVAASGTVVRNHVRDGYDHEFVSSRVSDPLADALADLLQDPMSVSASRAATAALAAYMETDVLRRYHHDAPEEHSL